jgi:hypothetical protein
MVKKKGQFNPDYGKIHSEVNWKMRVSLEFTGPV